MKYLQVSTTRSTAPWVPPVCLPSRPPSPPNSPYSASKAGADLIVRAYHETYGMPVNITRCSNNYGPYQFPEKLIPLMIHNCLENRPLPVYGDGMQVRDCCMWRITARPSARCWRRASPARYTTSAETTKRPTRDRPATAEQLGQRRGIDYLCEGSPWP